MGRAPFLTGRGRAWAVGGALLVLLGALTSSWQVVGLGVLSLSALGAAYLLFLPAAVLLWRRYLEMSWRLERASGGFVVGRPIELHVTLRHRGAMRLGKAAVRVFASSAIETPPPLKLEISAEMEVTQAAQLTAKRIGTWHLHGAAIELESPLGIARVAAYFPNPMALKVFPRREARAPGALARPTAGAPHERLGLHTICHRGLGGDLRELRDHAPGDPFKQIAWKATARTGKLMVRDLDRETMVTHWLLVDQGPTMRASTDGAASVASGGPIRAQPGRSSSKLDDVVDLAAAYARGALEAGDRVGLLTYDERIVGELKPNDGPVHRMRLLELLMQAMNPVDEDLTDLTDSELVQAVARYVLHQEGVEARVFRTPPIDDPAWSHLATSPAGELYDLRVLGRAVTAALGEALAGRAEQLVRASGPDQAKLRLYCRHRGIELPPRKGGVRGRRAQGLAAALERAASGRGMQRIVVLSDLEGLDLGLDAVARAVRLARRRGHRLTCAQPALRVAEAALDPVADVLGWEVERRARAARRRMTALGLRVQPVAAAERVRPSEPRAGRLGPGAQRRAASESEPLSGAAAE